VPVSQRCIPVGDAEGLAVGVAEMAEGKDEAGQRYRSRMYIATTCKETVLYPQPLPATRSATQWTCITGAEAMLADKCVKTIPTSMQHIASSMHAQTGQ
jgi:hypothetical protein